jgi:competence protein ComEC
MLRALGVSGVDRVVLSHGDADHVGGAAELARALPGADMLGSLARGQTFGFARARRCVAGQRWRWDGVDFLMLHPPPGTAPSRRNAASCVLRVAGAHGSVLLSGDIERAQELALVAAGAALRVDLLLVPHHGSRGASSEALLRATRARVAAAQVGWRNRYGHPHPQALQRYAARGVALHRTDLEGALRWRDAETAALQGWRALHPRYWRAEDGRLPQ